MADCFTDNGVGCMKMFDDLIHSIGFVSSVVVRLGSWVDQVKIL